MTKAAEGEGGTDAVKLGEELVCEPSAASALRTGKGMATARRIVSGEPCVVSDQTVAVLDLKADKMKLSWQGSEIRDEDRLAALGLCTDDAVDLEFESPTTPDILKLLRGPEPEKKEKGGKKKK